MDERLQAGRQHLLSGERALDRGQPDEGRIHFEAALQRFRVPEQRLGEARAVCGLARIDIYAGRSAQAELRLREAIALYQGTTSFLDRAEDPESAAQLRQSREGEAHASVLLAELLVRLGRVHEARTTLDAAHAHYEAIGDLDRAAAFYAAQARLHFREGRYARSREAFETALKLHRAENDQLAEASTLLSLAELERMERRLAEGETALTRARALATELRNPMLQGRVAAALGSLMMQLHRLREAQEFYEEAIPLVRRSKDAEMEGFALVGLGNAMSRRSDASGIDFLLDGARILVSIDNAHGVATALLRLGEHGLRNGEPGLGLVAAEGARRIYAKVDPVRGVGQAWRLVVKALAATQPMPADDVLAAAMTREIIAGATQKNAKEVADYYRTRAEPGAVGQLAGLSKRDLEARAEAGVLRGLRDVLAKVEVEPAKLDTTNGVFAVVEALSLALPRPAPSEEWRDQVSVVEEISVPSIGQAPMRNVRERVCLVLNPRSAGGATGARLEAVREAAARYFETWEVRLTERPNHASELAAQAAREGFDVVAAVGGDGTASEVVNGLFEGDRPINPKTIFSVIPAGTGSDLIKSLQIPTDVDGAMAAVAFGVDLPSDVLSVEFTDPATGLRARRLSINVCGFGINGDVVMRANRVRAAAARRRAESDGGLQLVSSDTPPPPVPARAGARRNGGRIGATTTFLDATIRSLFSYSPDDAEVTWIDGQGRAGDWRGPLLAAFAANGQYCGGGMWVGRGGTMQDGLVDLTIVPRLPAFRLATQLPRLFTGTMGGVKGVLRVAVRSFEVRSQGSAPVRIDVDGEQPGILPVQVTVLPHTLTIRGKWEAQA